jgi:exodeoxyribonuclease VII small subunit
LSPKADREGSNRPATPATADSFEAAYRELQQVVDQLEDGGLPLEDAVKLFERGSELVRQCQRIVDDAELRVTRLTAESSSPLTDPPAET